LPGGRPESEISTLIKGEDKRLFGAERNGGFERREKNLGGVSKLVPLGQGKDKRFDRGGSLPTAMGKKKREITSGRTIKPEWSTNQEKTLVLVGVRRDSRDSWGRSQDFSKREKKKKEGSRESPNKLPGKPLSKDKKKKKKKKKTGGLNRTSGRKFKGSQFATQRKHHRGGMGWVIGEGARIEC